MSHAVFGRGPVVVKRRRGDPTSAELQLLAQATRTGAVVLTHPRGHDMPPILTLAFEMVEQRRWLAPPGAPVVRDNKRYFTFHVTAAGSEAYAEARRSFGLDAS